MATHGRQRPPAKPLDARRPATPSAIADKRQAVSPTAAATTDSGRLFLPSRPKAVRHGRSDVGCHVDTTARRAGQTAQTETAVFLARRCPGTASATATATRALFSPAATFYGGGALLARALRPARKAGVRRRRRQTATKAQQPAGRGDRYTALAATTITTTNFTLTGTTR